MESSLNLGSLWPDLSNLSVIPPQTSEQLSAQFVVVLWIVAGIFLFISFSSLVRGLKRVAWLNKLLNLVAIDDPASIREDLVTKAGEKKNSVGHLWLEFDETLLEVKDSDDVIRLYNIFDADYFFNTSSLAGSSTENRMIAAVPGFLTAIGVIGTFVGLQLGLSDLNIAGNVDVNEMKDGIAGVINGAKIAFMTSVWGVLLSVIFNFMEKGFEQIIRKKIHKLQNRIDRIFPRLSAEAQLQCIANDSQQSRESLQGLAEKIGEKMQESLIQATDGIQQGLEASLEKIMAPAINKLVDETSDGNQKALESVLQSFMDGFGQQGEEQRLAMDSASTNVHKTLESMSVSLEAFVNKLDAQQSASSEREKELISSISVQVSELVTQGNEQKRMLTEFVEKQVSNMGEQLTSREIAASKREQKLASSMEATIKGLVDNVSGQSKVLTDFVNNQVGTLTETFSRRDEQSSQMEKERNEIFVDQTRAMKSGTDELLAQVKVSIESQQFASNNILQQGKQLQNSIESSISASVRATESMQKTAIELRYAADSMRVFGSNIKDAGNKLSGAVTEAVNSTKDLAMQNQLSSVRIESLRDQLIEDTGKFSDIANQINNMLKTANESFDTLKLTQTHFLSEQKNNLSILTAEMKKNVSELSDQMSTLLEDYAIEANGQTTEHLKIWANSSTQYATQMNNAVQAISNVVDEIQNKVSQ
ncbi:anti-phage ZorAB system protein ZorA [Photobacterium carnosum]|uniref:anti-phage ZorAB system protein ZorA n=1 Tax=Photobacterium carnosum TaxID=2023717 RepID=UPI001E5DE253|nr:anti-phage ZorAB system protein ZorA [Photobacterium carnosum]MCD9494233.1 anti-phage defense ZorAB system ZorA [Photobacterium carnosum]